VSNGVKTLAEATESWTKDKNLTIGELLTVMLTIDSIDDADLFMQTYTDYLRRALTQSQQTQHTAEQVARMNIGYIKGYLGPEQIAQINQVFDVAHPIFGF